VTKGGLPARKLFKHALIDFWRFKGSFVATTALVAAPLAILANLGLSQDSTFSAYSSFASLIMNLALIWLVMALKSGQKPTMGQAYYKGTSTLVRFLLIVFSFFFMSIPFLLGALFYIQGVTGTTVAASGPEKMLLGVVWFILAIPSVLLLSKYLLSIFALVDKNLTPFAALSYSSRLVKGRTLRVLMRVVALAIISILIVAMMAMCIILFSLKGALATVALTGVQLVSIVVLLPIINLYLYGLYQGLHREQS
jgi:hypothetical protein